MPISPLVLQQRHAELGRIRLGDKVATSNGSRPHKLTKFRFTSGTESYIRELAAKYGGEARPWKNGSKDEWEVYSEAKSIPVVVLKSGLSQWFEFWSAGGCIHRCDGITNVLTDEPCDLTEKVQVGRKTVNPHTEAKPTTRVSMMLAELEAIGAFRLETHGWNAAAEIPAVAELAAFVGPMVPAVLHLVERTSIKGGQTSQFVVPVLDLKIGAARLNEIVNAKMEGRELAAPGSTTAPAALNAGTTAPAVPDYLTLAQDASSFDTVVAIRAKAEAAGHLTPELDAQLRIVADSLRAAAAAPPGPDADGAYDAELVDENAAAEADMLWQRCLAEGGKQGLNLQDVIDGYSAFTGGLVASDANAAQLQVYLEHLGSVTA